MGWDGGVAGWVGGGGVACGGVPAQVPSRVGTWGAVVWCGAGVRGRGGVGAADHGLSLQRTYRMHFNIEDSIVVINMLFGIQTQRRIPH